MIVMFYCTVLLLNVGSLLQLLLIVTTSTFMILYIEQFYVKNYVLAEVRPKLKLNQLL